FFSCSSPLPDLTSFPTRRSSDLGNLTTNPFAPQLPECVVRHHVEGFGARPIVRRGHAKPHGSSVEPVEHAAAGDLILVVQEREGDRKSTRLNSSHVAISYAVFCL